MVWITWCFYQLFGLSFWRHPFTAEHPFVRQWCNDTFLQICSDEETNSSTSWMAWVNSFTFFWGGWTITTNVQAENYGPFSILLLIVFLTLHLHSCFINFINVTYWLFQKGPFQPNLVWTDLALSVGWGCVTAPAVPWISCWIRTFLGGLAVEWINAIFTCLPKREKQKHKTVRATLGINRHLKQR